MPADAEALAPGEALSMSDGARRAATESRSDAVAPLTTGLQFDSRTRLLLKGPIVGTLVRLATPNVLVMFVQASVGLLETYFVAKLGTEALAGVALVFPVLMLMQMMSAARWAAGSHRPSPARSARDAGPMPMRWCSMRSPSPSASDSPSCWPCWAVAHGSTAPWAGEGRPSRRR